MKKFLILPLAALTFATPALAEEEGDEWNGAYIGVSVGYNTTKSESKATLGGNWSVETQAHRDFVVANAGARQSVNAADFGAQIGYNAHLGGGVVAGLEAEGAYLSGKASESRGPIAVPSVAGLRYTFTNSIDPKFTGAVKAKLGIATSDSLFYATGGWRWTRAEVGAGVVGTNNYLKGVEGKHTFDGYVVGAGVEQKFSRSVSARIEYTYSDQGKITYQTGYLPTSALTTPARSETYRQNLSMHQVRVGLNFHF